MAKLKVFCGVMYGRGQRRVRTIIAATSKKRAAELLCISSSSMSAAWTESRDRNEIELALKAPEVVFQASDYSNKNFIKAEGQSQQVIEGEK